MSKRTLSIGLVLAPVLVTSVAAADGPQSADEPRETTANAPKVAVSPAPASAPETAPAEPVSAPAAAAPVPKAAQPASSELHTVSHWYGWQTLTTDGISLMLSFVALGAVRSSSTGTADSLALLSLGTYVAGGPIVHLAHGNVAKGLGSLGLRAGLPILAGVAGSALERSSCTGGDFCGLGGAFLGGVAGVVSAMVIDSAVLGREQVTERASNWPIVGVASDGQSTLLTAHGRF